MKLLSNPCGIRPVQPETHSILMKPRAFPRICSELRRGLAASLRFARQGGLLAGLFLSAVVPVAQANLIANGSFEDPPQTLGDGIYFGVTPDDWVGGAGLFRGETASGGYPASQHGNQSADIGTNPAYSLSQAVALAAGTYTLTWYDNAGIGFDHSYSVEVDGDSKGSFSGTGAPDWTLRSLTFALSAGGAYTLKFVGAGPNDTLLDNVSLEAASVGSVPDSGSSFVMVSSAFAGICLLRRRPATC